MASLWGFLEGSFFNIAQGANGTFWKRKIFVLLVNLLLNFQLMLLLKIYFFPP